ncbi:hypothetical protein ACX40Y_07845 [Sphingomonas sp. RS6]
MIPMLVALLAGVAPLQDQTVADPLAPARAGRIRCIDPDRAARTCRTIVRYTTRAGGGFDAMVTGVVSRDPTILIEYSTFGQVRDGAVCSRIRPVDFRDGRLTSNGAPLTPVLAQSTRDNLMLALQPLAGKERCYRETMSGDEIAVSVTIDGIVQSDMSQTAIWVMPEDGYAPG